jgi:predicted methyltransferase
MSAKYADEVFTFERDDNVIGLCRLNPFSQELFTNKKIKLKEASIFDEISKLKSESFDRIIHDPPTFKVSPELYSDGFYKELYRVMKKGGILYHYAPAPGKTKGKAFYENIIKHIKAATEFKNIAYHEKSSGIRAVK